MVSGMLAKSELFFAPRPPVVVVDLSVCLSVVRKEKKNREKVGNWREVQMNKRCGEKVKGKVKVCKVR